MRWIVNFVPRRQVDRQLDREVQSHLEEKVADLMDSGLPEREARQKARREFGNVALYTQDSREVWSKRFRMEDGKGPWVEIVGVAKTAKYLWIGKAPTEFLYLPLAQHPSAHMTLVAQSFGDAAALVAPLSEMVRGLDANQPVFDVRTMADLYYMRAVGVPGMINQVVGAMGLVGLLLAMAGLYGLMAYSVARRTREIGIRMAIGADRASVARMVLRQGFNLALTGLVIGLAASFAAEKAVMAVFSAAQRDPLAYLLVAPALLAVTMLAAWAPAHRAARVDPMRALRNE